MSETEYVASLVSMQGGLQNSAHIWMVRFI